MLSPRSLRGRLTIFYASALAVALIAFAALALAVIDRAQRSGLDAELATTARAVLAIVDASEGSVRMDDTDRAQFAGVVGVKANGALFLPDGKVLQSSSTSIPPAIRRGARTAAARYVTMTVDGDALQAYFTPIEARGVRLGEIAVWRDAESIDALDTSVALAFALAIPLLVAIAVFFGGAVARRGLAPLDQIATVASEIEGYDLSRRLALPQSGDELGRLAATFDRMLDRLQHAFSRERRFTSDASHELRAPLSVIRAEADLALRKERTAAEYRGALEAIVAEADALEALTRDLLAAARAEEPPQLQGSVDLGLVARSAAGRLRVLADARRITIETAIADGALVRGRSDALERAIITVLHNAIKYGADGGRVELRVARERGVVELCVADDGPGFSADALRRAFDRFWRDDEARGRDGSGLGLAIAKAIVEAGGGTIAVANGEDGGAVVRLRFDAQPPGGASSS